MIRSGALAAYGFTEGHVPGGEVAGTVAAIGDGVDPAWLGRRVWAFTGLGGGYAEQAVAPATACIPLPDDADFDVAAAFTLVYGTSHHAVVDRAALKAGETMLVLGAAGGVGLAAVEIGKALGLTRERIRQLEKQSLSKLRHPSRAQPLLDYAS